ncbi:cytochrome b/b6 domain-containing protein [Sulfitobacter sp. JB4-11]|uniref:cytochrome b/b6 domain-containing protein n=1 Tax=Sulfitobacter rhodophyticola TaxID=3238304 RepID=UPI0035127CD2
MPIRSKDTTLVRRHTWITRITHWVWAISSFFLLLTGLQIFNAHPALYLGDQSGFAFSNTVLEIGEQDGAGFLSILGMRFDGFAVLGLSGGAARAFPQWATIPSGIDLATGRVIHFFFAWIFVGTLLIWTIGAFRSKHIQRDLTPRTSDLTGLLRDIRDHLRLRFHHGPRYGPLQRLSYGIVLFVLFPLIVATGFAMSPGLNAAMPWLPELLGGRQTARTLHFLAAFGLLIFVVVHLVMVLLAGPLNEMRAITTGWYRATTDNRKDVDHDV